MDWLVNIAVVIGTFLGMEGVAWFAHKYIMHTFLWVLHEEHHVPKKNKFLERNDAFFLIFATPAMIAFLVGYQLNIMPLVMVGLGITLYGLAYFLVHDVFIHQRIKWFRNTDSAYLRAIRKAHKVHHKHLGKEDGECFGMLFVPRKYYKEAKQSLQA